MTRTDAWTGEEFTGKGVILNTTEGPEVVDIRSLNPVADPDAPVGGVADSSEIVTQLAELNDRVVTMTATVAQLDERLSALETVPVEPTPEPEPEVPATEAKTSARKAAR